MAVRAVRKNNMPIYTLQCNNCGHTEEMFFGKVMTQEELDLICKKCGKQGLKKIPMPINNAGFSNSSSRRSLKTRTGVGELIMKQGAKKMIEDTARDQEASNKK
jgi:predicted nucleic acid-binding Zn ribbon protein